MGVDEKALGQRLQKARQRAGLTQQELCQKAGLSYSTLAKIERGAIKAPSIFTVAAIAAATGATFEKLLDIKLVSPNPGGDKKVSKTGIRFVYFDIGGTLLSSHQWVFTDIADKHNLPVDKVETSYLRYSDQVETGKMDIATFNQRLASDLGIPEFDWQQYQIKGTQLVPGSAELLKWVSDNYDIGLITNIKPGSVKALRDANLLPKVDFKVIIDSSEVGFIKPQPEIYEIAQKKAGVRASEILLVDNERPNIKGAVHAGWQTLWFNEYDPADSDKRVKEALAF